MAFLKEAHDIKTLFSLMRTCRILYNGGAPHILSLPIKIGGKPSHMHGFVSFVSRNLETRLKYIRSISLAKPSLRDWNGICSCHGRWAFHEHFCRLLRRFIQVVLRCRTLTHFEFCGSEEWLGFENELFTRLIVDREAPLHVLVGGRESLTTKLITSACDRIEVFSISFDLKDHIHQTTTELDVWDPRPLIAGFERLEELHIKWPLFSSINDYMICDDVRTLVIEYHHDIDVVPILRSFNYIRNLILYPSPNKWPQLSGAVEENILVLQERNREIQDAWDEAEILDLDYYGGDALGLCALYPVGRIAHLDVRLDTGYWRCYEHLHDAIWENRPKRVTVHYTVDWGYDWLAIVIPSSMAEYVSHLDLTIAVGRTLYDINRVEVSLCHFLSPSCF